MPTIPVDQSTLEEIVENGNELLAVIQTSATNLGNAVTQAEAAAVAASDDRDEAEDFAISAAASAASALALTTNAPSYKIPVRLISTTNVVLSGTADQIDGRTVVPGDRILAVAQNDQTQNGIWVAAAGAWSRATDADTAAELQNAVVPMALDGDSNYGMEYRLVVNTPITLGTTKLTFVRNSGGHSNSFDKKIGTAVIVGNSNRNGRTAYYTALPLEITGPLGALSEWTFYNMGQNGSQLAGWRIATEAMTFATAPAPADYTGVTNPYTSLYQVCKAAPDIVLFSLGINDFNSPANRAGPSGTNFSANLDWAVNFLLTNNPNKDSIVILEVPQPYTGINFVSGPFTTDWGGDAATYGNANAADNAAYFSRVLRGNYLRWKGRNPRVMVHDTAEIFNPGAVANPLLHRCDDPKLYCLDKDASKVRFAGSITSNVLTVTAVYGNGTLQVGDPVTADATGNSSTRTVTSLGTGTGGTGTYNLSAGADSPQGFFKVPKPLIDDSLHFSGLGGRRIVESFAHLINVVGRRSTKSFVYSRNGLDPYWTALQNAYSAQTFFYGSRQLSGGNTILGIIPSPESLYLLDSPINRDNDARLVPYSELAKAEQALLNLDLGRIRWLSNLRGARIKLTVIGGTGTIYTASAASLSSISTNIVFYHNVQFNEINMTSEPASGRILVWVEDMYSLPYNSRPIMATLPPGTSAVASVAVPNPYSTTTSVNMPLRRFKLSRFAATDGACTVDVGVSNQASDDRLVETATTKTGTISDGAGGAGTILTVADGTGIAIGQTVTGSGVTAGTQIVSGSGTTWGVNNSQNVASTTLTFGISTTSTAYNIGTFTFTASSREASYAPNATNINNAVNAGIGWPANFGTVANEALLKGTYRLMLAPSITLTKPLTFSVTN